MRKLSLILLIAIGYVSLALMTDSPHGKDFRVDCGLCHSPDSWKLDKSIYAFDHGTTAFPLAGQHNSLACRACHLSLVFSEARTECAGCHTDIHEQTVGPDCQRCHTTDSWIVDNITEIHRKGRFPLTGPHYTTDCGGCHRSASLLRFDPLGTECYDCHRDDYESATEPNHVQGNFSTNCVECHSPNNITWSTTNIDHSFFPLTQGHAIGDCQKCHTGGNYSTISAECASCHTDNYNATTNPNHGLSNFPVTCNDCHTTNPGWKPATFADHDARFFPVYSGKHIWTWTTCAECHTNTGNYSTFSCVDCHAHNQTETNGQHTEVGGYVYASIPCYECHPTGSVEGSFNHSTSAFPLTGAHTTTPCSDCHSNGFVGTPTECSACHMPDYNQTTNPNHTTTNIANTCATCHTTNPGWKPATFPTHNNYYELTGAHATISTDCFKCHQGSYTSTPVACSGCHQPDYNQTTNPNHSAIGIPSTCADCHTTNPDWRPALFPIHNNYYILQGAHAAIANNCATCHNGNYNTTPNTCAGCHMDDYNQTTNPPHLSAQFPTECQSCHNQNAWVPSTFNHDGQYFPIYSGKHQGQWNLCSDCHYNASNYAIFSCINCHEHSNKTEVDNKHNGVPGYTYTPTSCFDCHPDGTAPLMANPKNIIRHD